MKPQGCEEGVIDKIRLRREAGRKKYGVTMERTDLKRLDWLRHAQEEAMDLAIYLERLIRDEESALTHIAVLKQAIVNAVTAEFSVSPEDLLSRTRTPNTADARQVVYCLMRRFSDRSTDCIAALFGRRHSTVIWACRSVRIKCEMEKSFSAKFEAVKARLQNTLPALEPLA
jgi:chromosomal replication initiation ATPase DnaA